MDAGWVAGREGTAESVAWVRTGSDVDSRHTVDTTMDDIRVDETRVRDPNAR